MCTLSTMDLLEAEGENVGETFENSSTDDNDQPAVISIESTPDSFTEHGNIFVDLTVDDSSKLSDEIEEDPEDNQPVLFFGDLYETHVNIEDNETSDSPYDERNNVSGGSRHIDSLASGYSNTQSDGDTSYDSTTA